MVFSLGLLKISILMQKNPTRAYTSLYQRISPELQVQEEHKCYKKPHIVNCPFFFKKAQKACGKRKNP
ncbi:uncharacterized protein TOL2_C13210 [Desulfobacula toluolica Tol2]|uniref:Uncharacterized protein n=1 Tax=Desulfobacula toluolica (strain DSM 7467 / Tol2) TaxID=651182 RepID=K0N631_DESTT|nr:uncharacterized protein TOL2_C13210 [Desulfobacula toluolica Tol2]